MVDVKTIIEESQEKMDMAVMYLEEALAHIRAGKASTRLLDGIRVDSYGSMVPISNVAAVTTPDARSITIKPWDKETCFKKLELAKASKAFAIAMDVDAAGLPFLQGRIPPAGRKCVAELKKIINYAKVPFIVKGIMSVEGAQKAINAGAQGIVVSNHGGRVLDGTPATASVLEEIADQFKGQVKIIVDGGIRSGFDVFKALALGADAGIIARPFVNMIYGNGEQGVEAYVQQLGQELENTMMMTGVSSLKEISKKNIYK